MKVRELIKELQKIPEKDQDFDVKVWNGDYEACVHDVKKCEHKGCEPYFAIEE